jgi:hypothetical protein
MSAEQVDSYLRDLESSLHFSVDRPLPRALVKKLMTVRLADAGLPLR